MAIPLSRLFKLGALRKSTKYGNITKTLGLSKMPAQKKLDDLIQAKPYLGKELDHIDSVLSEVPLNQAEINPILNYNESSIDKVYNNVDSHLKSNRLAESFSHFAEKDLKGNVDEAIKSRFRGVDGRFRGAAIRQENNLLNDMREKGALSFSVFQTALKAPDKLVKQFGISQDDLMARVISGKVDDLHPEVGEVVKTIRDWDSNIIKELQTAGINIGKIDGYGLPISVPADSVTHLGVDRVKAIFKQRVSNMSDDQIDNIINKIDEASLSTSDEKTIGFSTRNIEFNSPQDEVAFLREINGLAPTDNVSLFGMMLQHKKTLAKKSSLMFEFGADPKKTFSRALRKVQKNVKDENVRRQLSETEKNFNSLYDWYNGKKNITNRFLDNLGDLASGLTSLGTGASGGSFLRNFLFDFSVNKLAAKQAIYNPKYTLGGVALDFFQSAAYLAKSAVTGKATRSYVDKILDTVGMGNSLDNLTHYNQMTIENIFDVTSPVSKGMDNTVMSFTKGIHNLNGSLLKLSGNQSLIDLKRAKHIMSANQLWTNLLDNVESFQDWLKMLSPLEQRQVRTMGAKYGIGEREFNLLKKVQKYQFKNKNYPAMITPESIISSTDVASEKDLLALARGWQNLLFNSIQQATPTANLVDSISARSGFLNMTSAMRLFMRIPIKFADVVQSQFNGVAQRVALATYGNHGQSIGLDSSLVGWAKAGLVYTGGFVGVMWAKDLLYGKNFTDFNDPKNIVKALSQSGFGGFPAMILSSAMDVFGSQSGAFGTTPFGRVVGAGTSAYKAGFNSWDDWAQKGLFNKDPKRFYKAARSSSRFTGVGSLWYTRGLTDKAIGHAFLTPYERNRLNAR